MAVTEANAVSITVVETRAVGEQASGDDVRFEVARMDGSFLGLLDEVGAEGF